MLRRLVSLVVAVAFIIAALPIAVLADTIQATKPIRDMQWYLDPLRIPESQQLSDGSGVIVAVVEGGVDASHEDLAGQVLPGMGFGPYAGTDGRVEHGSKGDGHGTCMAGVIAAKGVGPNSTIGIAPGAKILPIAIPIGKMTDEDETFAQGIRWAVDHGAKVINMSFAVETISGALTAKYYEAARYAIDHDVVLVSSTGNLDVSKYRKIGLPANIPGVVAVANTDRGANLYYTSVSGPETVLAAPGADIVCPTHAPNGYGNATGTSSSGAIVSGVVALIRSKYPNMNAANVVNRLIKTAKDQGDPGRDNNFGFGTIRPYDALTANVASVSEYPLPLPEPSKAATTTNSKSRIDPATIGWGVGLGVLVLLLLARLVWRKIRRSRVQQQTHFSSGVSQPTAIAPQPSVMPPMPQPQQPVVRDDPVDQPPQQRV